MLQSCRFFLANIAQGARALQLLSLNALVRQIASLFFLVVVFITRLYPFFLHPSSVRDYVRLSAE
jgi:hypothetical protein